MNFDEQRHSIELRAYVFVRDTDIYIEVNGNVTPYFLRSLCWRVNVFNLSNDCLIVLTNK